MIADGLNVPELAPQIRAQKSHEDELMIVLRYFGDEGHPQPDERGALMPLVWGIDEPVEDVAAKMQRSPPWGRLPPLEDDEPAKHDVKGEPGRPRVLVTKDTIFEIFRQSLERARDTAKPPRPYYWQIADDNEVKRTWVTPIVKWVAGHQQEALHALAASEIPPRFSTCVRD